MLRKKSLINTVRFLFATILLSFIFSHSIPAYSQEWTRQTSVTPLFSTKFVNPNLGWAVGIDRIVHTTNGGTTWTNQTGGTGNYLQTVTFIDSLNGWAVGSTNAGQSIIIRTINGGTTWSNSLLGDYSEFLTSISFSDNRNGWAIGYYSYEQSTHTRIYHSTNRGSTWTLQYHVLNNCRFNAIFFSDSCNGWAVGGNGTIYNTTNGGENWAGQNSGTTNILYGLSFYDMNNGWVVGAGGIILHTTNGGLTWMRQISGTINQLNGVTFIDTSNGWAVGANGIINKTTNGGMTWSNQTIDSVYGINSVSFVDFYHGWAVSNEGILKYQSPNLYHSSQFLSFPLTRSCTTDSLLLKIANSRNTSFHYLTLTGASSGVFSHRVMDTDSLTPANDSLRIWIRFRPDSTLTYRDTLRLTFESPYNPITIPISGTGIGVYAYLLDTAFTFPRIIEPTLHDSLLVRFRVAGNDTLRGATTIYVAPFAFGTTTIPNTRPGDTVSVWLYFNPSTNGVYTRRLPIVVHAVNADTLWVTASGTSSYVPSPPGHFTITTIGNDERLTWSRVDTSLGGVILNPPVQRYIIYFCGDSTRQYNNSSYYYLASTSSPDSLGYTHVRAAQFSRFMYYKVTAWMGASSDSFDRIIRTIPIGTPESEVLRRVDAAILPRDR